MQMTEQSENSTDGKQMPVHVRTKEITEIYDRKGYVRVPGAFSPEEVASLQKACSTYRNGDIISYPEFGLLPFDDESFDCIIAGWALPYCNEKQKAVDEMVRMLTDGGLLMLAATYRPNFSAFTEKPIESSQDLREFLGGRQRHVFFDCDAKKIDPGSVGAVMLLASINKSGKGVPDVGKQSH